MCKNFVEVFFKSILKFPKTETYPHNFCLLLLFYKNSLSSDFNLSVISITIFLVYLKRFLAFSGNFKVYVKVMITSNSLQKVTPKEV